MIDNRLTQRLIRGRSLRSRLSTRRCRGCADPSFHDAHLTRYGLWRLERVARREAAR